MQGAWKLLFVLGAISMIAAVSVWPFKRPVVGASEPLRRWELRWLNRHRTLRRRIEAGPCDLVFVGDSITQNWETFGSEIWQQYYEPRGARNFGISSDRTEHVLWRINDTDFTKANPKLFVLLVGTNNAADYSAAETASGIKAIINALRKQVPTSQVLLMAIFPRGEHDDDPRRQTNDAVNLLISKFADDDHINFVDIGPSWTNPDGTTNLELMPDALHPHEAGYKVWADAIEPKLKELFGESPLTNPLD